MNTRSLCGLALIACVTGLYNPLAYAEEPIFTHCRQNEFPLLNAKIHRVKTDGMGAEVPKSDNEKILSLCADKDKEPFSRLYYRLGEVGKVEIELIASPYKKAGLSTQSDSGSHTGVISIQFKKDFYTYEISEGMGMTAGVQLTVYRSSKRMLNFRSDNFESEMIHINFEKISSPIFKQVKPIEPW